MILMDSSNKFGPKKSIKSRFEYDLDQNLGGCRSNRISLENDLNDLKILPQQIKTLERVLANLSQ